MLLRFSLSINFQKEQMVSPILKPVKERPPLIKIKNII